MNNELDIDIIEGAPIEQRTKAQRNAIELLRDAWETYGEGHASLEVYEDHFYLTISPEGEHEVSSLFVTNEILTEIDARMGLYFACKGGDADENPDCHAIAERIDATIDAFDNQMYVRTMLAFSETEGTKDRMKYLLVRAMERADYNALNADIDGVCKHEGCDNQSVLKSRWCPLHMREEVERGLREYWSDYVKALGEALA